MTPTDDHHNIRSNSPGRKRQNVQKKVNRPPPLVRKTAHTTKVTHKPSGSCSSFESIDSDEDPPMATSFQQYCATCDKQIVVPSASILYCSERCRRQDSQAQSLPLFKTDISPPPSPYTLSQFDNMPIRDIVPQRSPTHHPGNPPTTKSTYRSAADTSPTNISPDEKSRRPSAPRAESEAARYLAQFGSLDPTRSSHNRSSTTSTGMSTPSLSHTPSSFFGASMPYTPQQMSSTSQRGQQIRTPNPRWSSTSFSSRSVDLVTPISHASSLVTIKGEPPSEIEGIDSYAIDFAMYHGERNGTKYEKRSSLETAISTGRGSLKQLFRFEEMRSQPVGEQLEGDDVVEAPLTRQNS